MITVEHLTKRYNGGQLAVDDISFSIDKGGVWGLLGPNGAGKSTLMNMITGYLSATQGKILVDGVDLVEEPGKAKALMGYLPEIPPLYPEMGVEEYLNFVAELKGIRKKAQRTQEVQKAMEQLDLTSMRHRLIRNLSKGYRQRTGLAGALLGKPQIIILDEPTVGLDPAQIIEMRELIKELGKEHTVILSSHILSEVQSICDQVMIISQGKLVAQGPPDSLSQSRQVLHITAQGKAEQIEKMLKKIQGLEKLTLEHTQGEEVTFTAACASDQDLRRSVSLTLAKEGCPVLALTSEAPSLEEIFLKLTESHVPEQEEME